MSLTESYAVLFNMSGLDSSHQEGLTTSPVWVELAMYTWSAHILLITRVTVRCEVTDHGTANLCECVFYF